MISVSRWTPTGCNRLSGCFNEPTAGNMGADAPLALLIIPGFWRVILRLGQLFSALIKAHPFVSGKGVG